MSSAAATAALLTTGSAASQMFNAYANYGMSKKLMQKQYDLNMRAWREQNEYNLPVNQMSRLSDAGLNPYLVYSNGGASATASVPQGVSQGHFNGFNVDPLSDLANYQSILNQRANERLTNASEHYTNVQAEQAELTGAKQRELIDAQISQLGSSTSVNNENAFTQGLINSVVKAITGSETPQQIAEKTGGLFDNTWNFIGDALYWLSGTRTRYESQTIGSKLNKARLY